MRNAADGSEIGEARIELDELIDTNLRDLAKEYCVCINRTKVLHETKEKRIAAEGEQKKEKIILEMGKYTEYSGIIRFLTLFRPTHDTSLRFMQLKRNKKLVMPRQLLHFEYLVEKSDFDDFKFKIPQVTYNPNLKGMGEHMIDLADLIQRCESNKSIQGLLQSIQTQPAGKSNLQLAHDSIVKDKITSSVLEQIN